MKKTLAELIILFTGFEDYCRNRAYRHEADSLLKLAADFTAKFQGFINTGTALQQERAAIYIDRVDDTKRVLIRKGGNQAKIEKRVPITWQDVEFD